MNELYFATGVAIGILFMGIAIGILLEELLYRRKVRKFKKDLTSSAVAKKIIEDIKESRQ